MKIKKITVPLLTCLFLTVPCSEARSEVANPVLTIKKCSPEQVQNRLKDAITDINTSYGEVHIGSLHVEAKDGSILDAILAEVSKTAAQNTENITITVTLDPDKTTTKQALRALTKLGCNAVLNP